MTTDSKWACTQYATSRALARHVPAHQYEFADRRAPLLAPGPTTMPMGAQHASELWSLFDLGGFSPEFTPGQQRLSERMIDQWAAFARTGSTDWPRFPYVEELTPRGSGPVDFVGRHHCAFWGG
ncbi:carboxylesterase family protein [Actinokineospora globicatena]|uniref:carboxylesterase family protein n=1 Tax=Actinokineospora globicatena TaxID=103729 RepID=UPI0020A421A3|nr:carboxylesterase family protein [Actinokineospora globicatena]